MDLSSTTGNANPELLWLESVLVSRIDQFKHHKWKEGDEGYLTDYCLATSDVYAESFIVTSVTENGLLNTDEYDISLYPSDVSFDELASIAVCYFKLKDKQTNRRRFHQEGESSCHSTNTAAVLQDLDG